MSNPDAEIVNQTRSKTVFSPWETYHVPESFDIVSKVQEIMALALEKELSGGDASDSEYDEHSPFSSPLTSPESTPPTSPILKPNPLPEPPYPSPGPSSLTPDHPRTATDLERRKRRRKATRSISRKKKRHKASAEFGQYQVRQQINDRYVKTDGRHDASMLMHDIKVPKGGFVGNRVTGKATGKAGVTYRLEELVGPSSQKKFTLLPWDGIKTICLVGKDNRLIGILAGTPGTDDWPDVTRAAAEALESRRKRCVVRKGKKSQFRRGHFMAMACGVSYGGGQRRPMNVGNLPKNAQVLSELNSLACFQRISGFTSSIMASRTPDLYRHYADKIRPIYERNPTLQRPFPNSIFCSTTYNMGPETVCTPHLDSANLAYGKCAITSLGDYDPKAGGHLVLWECELVIEFPPGATILIPSAVLTHSNTPISPGETRYSFTQYTAGALFRWVENGFQTAAAYRATLSPEELVQEKEKDLQRWQECIELISVLDT